MGSNSEHCYSGGADARIHSWKIPDLNMDPYDGYGETASSPGLPFPTCHLLGPPRSLSTGSSRHAQHCRYLGGHQGRSAWVSVEQRDSACD